MAYTPESSTDKSVVFARRVQSYARSGVRMLADLSLRPGIISFAGGMPSPDVLPVDPLADMVGPLVRRIGPRSMQYAASDPQPELRAALERQLERDGITNFSSLVVTNGSQQGLDLVARVLLDPGDIVAIEAPSYPGALFALSASEPQFLPVSVDDEGVSVDELVRALGRSNRRPKLLYVVSTFSNPSSTTLSEQRRNDLLSFCGERGILIVDDNPYSRIRFDGQTVTPLVATDPGNVIALGSLSKIVAPGLRVGWVLAPAEIAHHVQRAKEAVDLCVSPLSQLLAASYLESASFERDLAVLIEHYRVRRDAMLEALEHCFEGIATWKRPDGGFFVWLRLHGEIDTDQLLEKAIERGVAFIPGSAFYLDSQPRNSLRLAYSMSSPEEIGEGISRLSVLCRELLRVNDSGVRKPTC